MMQTRQVGDARVTRVLEHPTLNTAHCVFPDEARQSRAAVLARAADRGALIMPMHFGQPHRGYVRREGDGYRFEPATWDKGTAA